MLLGIWSTDTHLTWAGWPSIWTCVCVCACLLSHVQLYVTPWNVALQAPLPTEFSRQEYWSGLPSPAPRNLPNSGTESSSPVSPALTGGCFTTEPPGKSPWTMTLSNDLHHTLISPLCNPHHSSVYLTPWGAGGKTGPFTIVSTQPGTRHGAWWPLNTFKSRNITKYVPRRLYKRVDKLKSQS